MDTYTVERSTTIAAEPGMIYPHLVDFHRWRAWSPWEDIDPDMQRSYEGADSGVGAVYHWSGNRKAGQGRMEIVEAHAPHELRIKLDFDKPFKSSNTTTFTLRPAGAGTHLTWSMVGPRGLMLRVMGVFMSMDKLVGKDFEKGLARLTGVVVREPKSLSDEG
jgi:hypothetical protein